MSITRHQIRLVRQSYRAASRERIAPIFFEGLFARIPSLRMLFDGDLRRHAARLDEGLGAIVDSLDRLDAIVPALEWLASRCSRSGLCPGHFAAIS